MKSKYWFSDHAVLKVTSLWDRAPSRIHVPRPGTAAVRTAGGPQIQVAPPQIELRFHELYG